MMQRRLPLAAAYATFFLSGAAALGYEVVWTRMLLAGIGHEFPAVLAVLGAWFGGFALGARLLDRPVSVSLRPARWYGLCELAVGLWGLAAVLLLPALASALPRALGEQPSPLGLALLSFGAPFLALLPATAAMGATLAAMERFVARLRASGAALPAVYGVNTAGAVAGVLVTVFLLLPAAGFPAASAALAAANLACALSAFLLLGRGEAQRPPLAAPADPAAASPRLWITLFGTGLLGIGVEVLGLRGMRQVTENTVYTFATALAVFLLGTSAGAALLHRFGARARAGTLLGPLLAGLAAAAGLVPLALALAKPLYRGVHGGLGPTPLSAACAELLLALAVFGPPTLLMGATFALLGRTARRRDGGVGRAVAVNTLGSALAPALFGLAVLPLLGTAGGLLAAAAGYLLLSPRFSLLVPAAGGLALGVFLLAPSPLVAVDLPPEGGEVEVRVEGLSETVAVVRTPDGHRLLKTSNHFSMGGTGGAFGSLRLGHLPLVLHPSPRRALFLGVGTGLTLSAAADHPGVSALGVELLPEVLELLRHFLPEDRLPGRHPGLRVAAADARRFVRAGDRRFDVVVADLFHPGRDGAGSLYTEEHFRAIRERLAPGGLFCQWLPLHQLDLGTLRLILRTFLRVYPRTWAFLSHYNVETPALGLVGGRAFRAWEPGSWEDRTAHPGLARALRRVGFTDEVHLLGGFLAGPRALGRWAGPGPVNTDARPRVTFRAPGFAYVRRTPHGRLAALLEALEPDPGVPLGGPGPLADRLGAYLRARDLFLGGSVALARGRRTEAVVGYLRSVRESPDFTAGYAALLDLAARWWEKDRGRALGVLLALERAVPDNPTAGRLRRALLSGEAGAAPVRGR